MKKFRKITVFLLALVLAFTCFAACDNGGDNGGDISLDDSGNARPTGDGTTNITFWGYGDENEIGVFTELVRQFNDKYDGTIHVNYEVKGNDDYATSAKTALRASKAKVDVLYVGDSDFKSFAELGYLEPLDSYIEKSSEIVIEDMWATSVNRFRYDVNTTTQDGPNAHYWGIPKDIGPTVVYYNETYFNNADVTVFSVAAEDLAAFNGGAKDENGNSVMKP